MPVGQQHDFKLAGKGYMLQRGEFRGRAWHRTGRADTPGARSADDAQYSALPDELDHAEVWDDWSGGYGEPYREPGSNRYHWAENFDARWPRQLVHCQALRSLGMTTSCNNNAIRVDDMPVASGNFMLYAGGAGALVMTDTRIQILTPYVGGSGVNAFWEYLGAISNTPLPVARSAIWGSNHYVPLNNSGSGFARFVLPPTAITGATFSSFRADGFAVAGNQLWKMVNTVPDRKCYVQNCAVIEPEGVFSLSNWSATLPIGGQHAGGRDMIAYQEQIMIGMGDGLYVGDNSGTFLNVTPDLAPLWHEDNCRDLAIHEGQVVFPHAAGLFAYDADSGIVTEIGKQLGAPWLSGPTAQTSSLRQPRGGGPTMPYPTAAAGGQLASPARVKGRFRCVKSYAGWLYAGLLTGSCISHVLAGRRSGYGWQWHTLQRLPNLTRIARLHIDGMTHGSNKAEVSPHMWIATDASTGQFGTGTAPLYYHDIPPQHGNPLVAIGAFSANYVGSARLDLGAVDWNAPSTPKVFRSVEVWADSLAASAQYADVYYTVDEGARTKLGSAYTSPKSTLFFSYGEGSFVTGQSIVLSLESFTYSATVTPVYRAVVLRGALRPKSVDLITAVVRIADNLRDRRGTAMRAAAAQIEDLRTLARSSTPVQLIDLTGAAAWVNVLRPIDEQEVYQGGEDAPEVAATVRMAILEYS